MFTKINTYSCHVNINVWHYTFLVDDLAFNFVTTFSGALLATTTSDKSIRTFRFTTTPCSIPYPPNLQHPVSELSCSLWIYSSWVIFVCFILSIHLHLILNFSACRQLFQNDYVDKGMWYPSFIFKIISDLIFSRKYRHDNGFWYDPFLISFFLFFFFLTKYFSLSPNRLAQRVSLFIPNGKLFFFQFFVTSRYSTRIYSTNVLIQTLN